MATVKRQTFSCDVCGEAKDVKTRTFELDGQAYEIDLCRKDSDALSSLTKGYAAKARKVTAGPSRRRRPTGSTRNTARTSRPQRQKGIYVYGILPGDIEVTEDVPGVGTDPGPLRDIRLNGLAALISEVDVSAGLGSPDDLKTHREILDAIAAEVPVLPLSFGTVLPSEDAVAEELLAARHDEFSDALEHLEGRAEFQVIGCYVKDAATAGREQDTRALTQAMEGLCVASVAHEPADEQDAVHVAFLVAVDREREVERVTKDLAREWAGRIDLQLLGPMAAYDFAETAQPET
jgi:Gas vesicle synthesis protein GvpL/GvpF/Lsr2